MMIFDANSGEFWQIFARQDMRSTQFELDARFVLPRFELELESRDDVPALLVGPQYAQAQRLFANMPRMRKLLTTRYSMIIQVEAHTRMTFLASILHNLPAIFKRQDMRKRNPRCR